MYKRYQKDGVLEGITQKSGTVSIPIDEANRDYIEFLQYLDEENLKLSDIALDEKST